MSAFARAEEFIEPLKELGRRIRTAVITARAGGAEMAGAARDAQALAPLLAVFYQIDEPDRWIDVVRIWDGRKDPAALRSP